MKIFGIGLNKTGTTSLGKALEMLGYHKHVKADLNLLQAWVSNDYNVIKKSIELNEVFEDWPWPLMYEWLIEEYPEAKFILTTRSSSDKWFQSLCKHADKTGATEYRKIVYGHAMPHDNKEHHIEFYERHNEEVRAYFSRVKKSDQLLELCWEKGDGWKQLCPFLDKEVPSIHFPTVNKSGTSLQKKIYRKFGLK